jgi:hypothetical protein
MLKLFGFNIQVSFFKPFSEKEQKKRNEQTAKDHDEIWLIADKVFADCVLFQDSLLLLSAYADPKDNKADDHIENLKEALLEKEDYLYSMANKVDMFPTTFFQTLEMRYKND